MYNNNNNNYYVKSKGSLQTFVNNNNNNKFNEIDWDAGYDGDTANIILSSNNNGNQKMFNVKLDNEDLANLLNVPSISGPIDKRLQMDFNNHNQFRLEPKMYKIELPDFSAQEPESIENIFQSMKQPNNYLSSPLSDEELIVPISIDDKTLNKYTLTPNKHHRHKKSHKTYRVYKKPKSRSSSKSKSHRSSSKSKTKTKRASNFTIF
jgi:hypothetical protein